MSDSLAGLIDYEWDAQGRLVQRGAQSFEWDSRERLLEVTENSAPVSSYSYDASGLKLRTSDAGGVSQFTWAPAGVHGGAPELLEVRAADNTLLSRPIRGAGRSVVARFDGSGILGVIEDRLGSALLEADASGVTHTQSFDPWGQVQNENGSTSSPLGYTGHEKADASGLIYMKARWYDPEVGVFVSEDPRAVSASNPFTLHEYVYADGDPVRFIDPDGRWASKLGFPVHQESIERTLKDAIDDDAALRLLMDEQVNIDEEQAGHEQFKHAMASEFECDEAPELREIVKMGVELDNSQKLYLERCEEFATEGVDVNDRSIRKIEDITRANQFVASELKDAARFFNQIRDEGSGRGTEQWNEMWKHIGRAMHTIQDGTSPSHRPFQFWPENPVLLYLLVPEHVRKEIIPTAGQKRELDDVTKWVYNAFCFEAERGNGVPTAVFDLEGELRLPWVPPAPQLFEGPNALSDEQKNRFAAWYNNYCQIEQ